MNEQLGKFVTEKPAITVTVIIFITILMLALSASPDSFGLTKKDTESESQWLPDNKYVNANDDISTNYGVQIDFLNIVIQGKDGNVLTKEALIDILTVEKKIVEDKDVQYILHPQQGNVSSIASALATNMLKEQGVAEENITYALMLETLEGVNQTTLDAMLTDAAEKVGIFLTKDFQTNLEKGEVKAKGSMMLIMINSDRYDEVEEGGFNPLLDADEAIESIFDDTDFTGVNRMGIIEEEYINQQINEETGGVMGTLFMLVFVLIIGILFLTYRSIFDTVISLMALVMAIMWMNGIGVILGLTFSSMYEMVPIMIMGLGIDYAIHLVMRYREERELYGKNIQDALKLTTLSVGAALFLATLTTGISFGSNTVSEIQPMREFSIFALVGIVSAFIVMVTFVPATKMIYHTNIEPRLPEILRRKVKTNTSTGGKDGKAGGQKLARFLARGSVAAEHHAYPVIGIVVVISIFMGGLSTQLDTEFDFTEFLPEGAQISEDIVYLTDNFAFGTEEGDILIKGDIDNPAVLRAMNETQTNILDNKDINEQQPINSILTLMHDVATGENEDIAKHQGFAENYTAADTDGDGIPDTNITDLLRFFVENEDYRMEAISVLHWVEKEETNGTKSYTFDGTVIRVGVNSQNGAFAGDIKVDLENDIKPLETLEENGEIDQVIATGEPILINVIITSIEKSGIQSLIITIVVAAVILTIVFYATDKSLVLGILTEIPVILVIFWVFGAMYLIGMDLNVMTIMISSMTVGLGITYGIHVTHRFVEDLAELDDIDKACTSTVVNTGTALFGAAVTTIGGFGILVFAPIPPMKKFGAISALAITFSLIASVFVLPTFLSLWAKWVKKNDPCFFQHHADIKHQIEENALACDDPATPAAPETKEDIPVTKGDNPEIKGEPPVPESVVPPIPPATGPLPDDQPTTTDRSEPDEGSEAVKKGEGPEEKPETEMKEASEEDGSEKQEEEEEEDTNDEPDRFPPTMEM
jgi:uncharacterized protein